MLTSTAGTKCPLEQRLADDQRQLVERGLVVEETPVLLELRLALGHKDVDVMLQLPRPGLSFPDIALELGHPGFGLLQRSPESYGLVSELDQFPAKCEAVEIGCKQRTQRFVHRGEIVLGRRGLESEALIKGIDIAGHGGKGRDTCGIA